MKFSKLFYSALPLLILLPLQISVSVARAGYTETISVVSDAHWKSSAVGPLGWESVDFDDSSWVAARAPYPNPNDPTSTIPGTTAVYMWHDPDHTSDGTTGVTRAFFRFTFNLDSELLWGRATINVDDDYDFYINGELVDANHDCGNAQNWVELVLTDKLVIGKNVFAFEAIDGCWPNDYDRIGEAVLFDANIRVMAEIQPLRGRLPATLGGTDYQAFYDPNLDITYTADADINGLMNWDTARAWLGDLSIGGVSGWRMPLLHEMWELSWYAGITAATPDPYSNIQPDWYWTATRDPYASYAVFTWNFDIGDYGFGIWPESDELFFVWPVHDGDVAPATVIDDTATIAEDAVIGAGSTVGAYTVIAKGATVGGNSTIGANATINKDVIASDNLTVGSNVIIHKDVVIGARVTIGDNTEIHKGTVVGNDVHIGLIGGGIGVFVGKDVVISSNQVIGDGEVIPNNTTVP